MRNEPEHEISEHGICFAEWLNQIDARIDYDVRRQIPVTEWRHLFDFGYCEKDACLMALTGRVR